MLLCDRDDSACGVSEAWVGGLGFMVEGDTLLFLCRQPHGLEYALLDVHPFFLFAVQGSNRNDIL